MAAVSGLFFFGLWILGPRIAVGEIPPAAFWLLTLAGGAHVLWFSPKMHGDPPEWRGWGAAAADGTRPGAFAACWRSYAGMTAVFAVLLLAGTAIFNPGALAAVRARAVLVKFSGYVVFGLVQAAVFFGFVMSRVRAAIPRPADSAGVPWHRAATALATAAIFALYHGPNAPLMLLGLPMAFVWGWLYYRWPNLPLLGLSHAILGTLLNRVALLPMRIGPFYERPDLYLLRTVVPGARRLIGNLY